MDEKKIVGYDYSIPAEDGKDDVTQTIIDLLNDFPGWTEEIEFSTLGETSGKAMFPTANAAILTEKEDITGHVKQRCAYAFLVVSRSKGMTELRRAAVKERLDMLGKWLQRQEIKLNGQEYKLKQYPSLGDNKRIDNISMTSQAYMHGVDEDNTEDWAIPIQAIYWNEFDR